MNCLCPYFTDPPILGVAGKAFLSTVALVKMEDIVQIAIKAIVNEDKSMNGHIYAIIPRTTVAEAREAGLHIPENITDESQERAVWDVEDVQGMSSDEFSKKIITLMNVAAKHKKGMDKLKDLAKAFK